MNSRRFFTPFCAAISAGLLLVLAACSVVPETGRRRVNMISPQDEMKMGLSAFQQIRAKLPRSRNREANAVAQRVASRLTRVVELPGAQWEFIVFEDPSPNAFALPGGKVGIHTGMFRVCENEAQLAAVVGHEIGHVTAHHSGERATHGMLAQLGGVALGAATRGSSSAQQLGQLYGMEAKFGAILPFSRKHELEADHIGTLYMARAGYDPNEAWRLWENMEEFKRRAGSGTPPEFASTHPMSATRIKKLKDLMPEAMREYAAATGRSSAAPSVPTRSGGSSGVRVTSGPLQEALRR